MPISEQYPFPKMGHDVWGHERVRVVTFQGPNPYAAGGVALGKAAGIEVVEGVIPLGLAVNAARTQAYAVTYDKATGKLQFFFGDYTNVADGPLVEPGAIDLSGFTVDLLVIGR